MTENNKLSQSEKAKQLLAKKKMAQAGGGQHGVPTSDQQVRSQINKKPNNQKRRTGV